MRFRFCGGGDCPDWLLAEMATLSRLTSVKVRLVVKLVADGLCAAQHTQVDLERISSLTTDAKFTASDVRAAAAALALILTSAAKV